MVNQGEAHFPKNLHHRRSPSFVPTPPGAQACPLGSVLPQASASPQAIIRDYYLGTKLFSSALFANPRKGGGRLSRGGKGSAKASDVTVHLGARQAKGSTGSAGA